VSVEVILSGGPRPPRPPRAPASRWWWRWWCWGTAGGCDSKHSAGAGQRVAARPIGANYAVLAIAIATTCKPRPAFASVTASVAKCSTLATRWTCDELVSIGTCELVSIGTCVELVSSTYFCFWRVRRLRINRQFLGYRLLLGRSLLLGRGLLLGRSLLLGRGLLLRLAPSTPFSPTWLCRRVCDSTPRSFVSGTSCRAGRRVLREGPARGSPPAAIAAPRRTSTPLQIGQEVVDCIVSRVRSQIGSHFVRNAFHRLSRVHADCEDRKQTKHRNLLH